MTIKRPFGLDALFSPHLIYEEHIQKLTPDVHQQIRESLNQALYLINQPRSEAIQILKSVLNTLDEPAVHENKNITKNTDFEIRVF